MLELPPAGSGTFPTIALAANDTAGGTDHRLDVSVVHNLVRPRHPSNGVVEDLLLELSFVVLAVNDNLANSPAFTAVLETVPQTRLRQLAMRNAPQAVELGSLLRTHEMKEAFADDDSSDLEFGELSDQRILNDEISSLRLLEAEAKNLEVEIAARKRTISELLSSGRGRVLPEHLLEHCEGLLCAAKKITQRLGKQICQAGGVSGYAGMQDMRKQKPSLFSSRVQPQRHACNCTYDKDGNHLHTNPKGAQPAVLPIHLTQDNSDKTFQMTSKVKCMSAAVATALGYFAPSFATSACPYAVESSVLLIKRSVAMRGRTVRQREGL